jgi:DNA-binding transcriptional MerR regulator
MADKLYYSMGEVTEMFDVEASLIRYWCSQFSCLRPKRNSKGNRMFTPQDIERLKRIHHLLKEKKMTIEGAQQAMKRRVIEAEKNDSDVALLERLQQLRASLVEMRDSIAELAEDVEPAKSTDEGSTPTASESEATPKRRRTPRRKLVGEEGVAEPPLFPFYEQRLF